MRRAHIARAASGGVRTDKGPRPRGGARRILIAIALAVAAFALYAQTGTFGFVGLDDPSYVANNSRVAGGLTWGGARWAFSTFHEAVWLPLTWLSFMLDASLFGPDPGGMHLVNAGLHAVNTSLVFVALARLTGATWKSAFVAALFALHPMHVESVAWITERKDVLSTFFGLLAIIAYERYARRPGFARFTIVAATFSGSLMAKAMLVTLPFVLLLLDVWPLRRLGGDVPGVRGRPSGGGRGTAVALPLLEKLPLLALSGVAAALAVAAGAQGGAMAQYDPGHRLANAVVSYARYVGKLLWPADLAVFYPLSPEGPPGWEVAGALLALVAITATALLLTRRAPWIGVGWFWFVGSLVPVVGLVQVGEQSMADRFTYFPSIGLFVAIVWGLGESGSIPVRRLATAALVVVLAGLTLASHRQIGLWSDEERLFRRTLAVTERNARAHEVLAATLSRRGKLDEAHQQLVEAVRLRPDPTTLADLGLVAHRLGRTGEAEKAFELALAKNPGDLRAALVLSEILASAGQPGQALEILRRAARQPHHPDQSLDARVAVGAALVDLGEIEEGMAVMEGALALDPGNVDILANLAEACLRRGDAARAERLAREAIAGGTRFLPGALVTLGEARMARGDLAGALDAMERAAKTDVEEPFWRIPLGHALARVGRLPEACASWAFVARSARATPSDQARAARMASASGCRSTSD